MFRSSRISWGQGGLAQGLLAVLGYEYLLGHAQVGEQQLMKKIGGRVVID